jgi:hypothetical protein
MAVDSRRSAPFSRGGPLTIAQPGTLTATLTSLSPQTTITMGFGVGQPSGTTCSILSGIENAKVSSVLSGSIAVGPDTLEEVAL